MRLMICRIECRMPLRSNSRESSLKIIHALNQFAHMLLSLFYLARRSGCQRKNYYDLNYVSTLYRLSPRPAAYLQKLHAVLVPFCFSFLSRPNDSNHSCRPTDLPLELTFRPTNKVIEQKGDVFSVLEHIRLYRWGNIGRVFFPIIRQS